MRIGDLSTARGLVVLGIVTLLAIVTVEATRAVRDDHRSEVEKLLDGAERTAQKLSAQTTEVFDRADQTTRLLGYLNEQPVRPALASLQAAGVLSDEFLQYVYLTDRRGFVLDTTLSPYAANVADEDFFKRHQREPALGATVGPARSNSLDKVHGVPVTRALTDERGFSGVVVVSVRPQALSVLYSRGEARGTAISICGSDGIIRVRTVDGVTTFGERCDPLRLVANAADARAGGLPFTSPIDGVKRFVAVSKVDGWPLYAAIAVDAEIGLAAHRAKRRQIIVWAGVFALATIGAGALLLRQASQLDASRARAKKAESDFRATLEGSLDGVLLLRPRRDAAGRVVGMTIVDCNSLAAAQLDTVPDRLLGTDLGDLLPSLRASGALEGFDEVIRTRQSRQIERQATEHVLIGRWLHHQIVPLDDGVALITRDVTERKLAERQLLELARVDGLTGLLNRRAFEEILQQARTRALRTARPLALMYIDLDGFKSINDSHGHAAGDRVLVEVAKRLRGLLREADHVARLGGDEFAVLLEDAGRLPDIQEIAGHIVAALGRPHTLENPAAALNCIATPSVGVALFDGAETPAALAARADAAMYRAKASGRARYVISPGTTPAGTAPAARATAAH